MSQMSWRRKVLDAFADFYYEKNNENEDDTIEEIKNLSIQQIETGYNEIFVWTSRPGLFIGKRGETIEKLEKFLSRKLNKENFKVKIFEKGDIVDEICWNIPYKEFDNLFDTVL